MLSIFKRLRNLWRISGLEITVDGQKLQTGVLNMETDNTPKMAQIIRMKDPVKEILKNE